MTNSSTFHATVWRAGIAPLVLLAVAPGLWGFPEVPVAAQKAPRLNRMIEALEAGRPAITGETWTWVEQEHEPYNIDKLMKALDALLAKRNAQGQVALAPVVRIPMEGDQSHASRWMIKQVLERGAMGVIVPHVENAEQALRLVQSMRFPQRTGSKYFTPIGRRGCGCGAPAGWKLANSSDYAEKFGDVWPLNPEGELFLMPMIEGPEGVKNINAILNVPGVGGALIGPSDLGMNLGNGSSRPRAAGTEAAIKTVLTACAKAKKHCGMVTQNDEETKKYLDMGATFMYAGYRPGGSYSPNRNH